MLECDKYNTRKQDNLCKHTSFSSFVRNPHSSAELSFQPKVLRATLTANIWPQFVVVILEQGVEDLGGIRFLGSGGQDPRFVGAEVIVVVFLCALSPAENRRGVKRAAQEKNPAGSDQEFI